MTTTNAIAPTPRFQAVPFYGTDIIVAEVGEELRVPMPGFCTAIGLEWEPQRKRIMRDEVMRDSTAMMEVPSPKGLQQTVTLPLAIIPGFLFTADVRRYRPEVQDQVALFRRECFAALHAHFYGRKGASVPVPVVPRALPVPAWQELDAARRSVPALINVITAERRPAVRRFYHALLAHDADRLGAEAPALDMIGHDAPRADTLIERLVAGLQLLDQHGRKARWNHFGRQGCTGRIAISLPEVARLFARYRIDIPIDDELRDALAGANRHYRVRQAVMRSELAHVNIYATILEPLPIEGGLS